MMDYPNQTSEVGAQRVQKSELQEELDRLRNQIDVTGKIVSQLRNQLGPVLRPSIPTPESPNKDSQLELSRSPLTELTRKNYKEVSIIRLVLEDICQRLAL